MAIIPVHYEAAAAMVKAAEDYGKEHGVSSSIEMGVALVIAGVSLMSPRINDVQLDEILVFVKELTRDLREPNAQ